MGLPAARAQEPVVRAHDAALEAVEERVEVGRLELEVAPEGAGGVRDGDAVPVEVDTIAAEAEARSQPLDSAAAPSQGSTIGRATSC